MAAEVLCPDCGRTNAADQKFCDGCGQGLVHPGAPSRTPTPSPAPALSEQESHGAETLKDAFAPNQEDLRAEYSALSSFQSTVVTFRFTTLGLYLAAVAFIVGGGVTRESAALLVGLSIALWLLELRNRALLSSVGERGRQIERQHWGYRGAHAYDPFYSHVTKVRPLKSEDEDAPEPPPLDYPRVWDRQVKIAVSYTMALDLVYLVVASYATYHLVFA